MNRLFGLQCRKNRYQEYMVKLVALFPLVYGVGLFVGEKLRDHCYGEHISTL